MCRVSGVAVVAARVAVIYKYKPIPGMMHPAFHIAPRTCGRCAIRVSGRRCGVQAVIDIGTALRSVVWQPLTKTG
jgi:hypothetical protein